MADCTYAIVSQRPTMVPDASGRYVDGYEIRYATGDGVPGVLKVPLTQYTPEQVDKAIRAQCANVDAIANLGK